VGIVIDYSSGFFEATPSGETVGSVSDNATLDLTSGNVFNHTPTANTTFAFSNPPASGTGQAFTLKLTGVYLDSAYDVANAKPPTAGYGYLNVAAQDTSITHMFFKPDGLKLYVVGYANDNVYEYDLSTAWEISSASFLQSFSVAAQEATPRAIFFKPDGLKMYVTGSTGDDVNEYDLSTAWDISTASYLQNFSVSAQDTSPQGLFFKPDGLKMYIAGGTGKDVNEYDLSTAWDISTASYLQNFSFAPVDSLSVSGIFFKPDGSKMYFTGFRDINEYNLSTAWDVSSASFLQALDTTSQESYPAACFFKPDGSRLYTTSIDKNAVFSYTLTTGWDVSTGSYDYPTEGYFSVAAQETSPNAISFKPDGLKMYIVGQTGDAVNEYDLSTAWEISSASFLQSFSVSSQDLAPAGLFFKPDGLKMYVLGLVTDSVYEYNLSTAWDVSSASSLQSFSVSSQETNPHSLFFKPDGLKMYVLGITGDDVNEYNLSTAWDVSSASFLQSFSVSAQEINPQGVFFKPDGLKMFVIGASGDDVNEYDLSTAWDVSTASFLLNFYVGTQENLPQGVFFSSDGTKMYITGQSVDAVWAYTTGIIGPATFTYPSSVEWPSGTAPDAPAVGETDILSFYTTDGGTTYYGFKAGDAMA
jgi:6-phosphogluconolactonase (cycloisomerase 2 family)